MKYICLGYITPGTFEGMTVSKVTRRSFMEVPIALGATAAWAQPFVSRSSTSWRERRGFHLEGVASGDHDSNSVLLWTRRLRRYLLMQLRALPNAEGVAEEIGSRPDLG